jgi:ubiquitin carboxyl-terminal hydrolase 5/13
VLTFDEQHLGKGLQPDETELQDDAPGGTPPLPSALISKTLLIHSTLHLGTLPEFNEAALAQLEAMGFPLVRCQKALLATGNSDPEAAMEWLFAHMEDPGAVPLP